MQEWDGKYTITTQPFYRSIDVCVNYGIWKNNSNWRKKNYFDLKEVNAKEKEI